MNTETLIEIIDILRKAKREDLIEILEDELDGDYIPDSADCDVDCSSGEDEEFSVAVDSNGFCSLR